MKLDNDLDLVISRVIRTPRSVVWKAWTEPEHFEKWWVPAPERAHVVKMNVRPGDAFLTELVTQEGQKVPHMNGSFLELEQDRRIVFTTALTAGWRPAPRPAIEMTSIVTLEDHEQGTKYTDLAMHKDSTDRQSHADQGFTEGWGLCIDQLGELALKQSEQEVKD